VRVTREAFMEACNSHYRFNTELFPIVEDLAQRLPLALLSNINPAHAEYLVPRLPILKRFQHVLLSFEVGFVKPETAFYQAAIDRLGVPAQDVAFFDDIPAYVDAARALGLQGHVFTTNEVFLATLSRYSPPTG
jgi:putative hydrolase of the HAD superfamily